MPARLGFAALIGILAAIGLMAGYTFRYGQPAAAPAPAAGSANPGPHGPAGGPAAPAAGATGQANVSTLPATAGAGHGPAAGKGPATRWSQVHAVNTSAAAGCNTVGENNMSIGWNIKWLLDNHDLFRYRLHVYPENRTIAWTITAPDREALTTLASHIMQMECVVKSGGNPRPFDPLFKVDAAISSRYIHTEIERLNDTAIKIVKTADNDCAFEVIKLHAQVVRGFFDTGRVEAQRVHEVPEDVLAVCKPYLGEG